MNVFGATVVVWEWEAQTNIWVPYSARICQHIENEFRKTMGSGKVDLSQQYQPELGGCEIDFTRMEQVNLFTGEAIKIRQKHYPSTSPFANGVFWTWYSDFKWQPYDVATSNYIENEYLQKPRNKKLQLRHSPIRIPNTINFVSMEQVNRHTKFSRKINREVTRDRYPQANHEQCNFGGQIRNSNSNTTVQHGSLVQQGYNPVSVHNVDTRTGNNCSVATATQPSSCSQLFSGYHPNLQSSIHSITAAQPSTSSVGPSVGAGIMTHNNHNGLAKNSGLLLHHTTGQPSGWNSVTPLSSTSTMTNNNHNGLTMNSGLPLQHGGWSYVGNSGTIPSTSTRTHSLTGNTGLSMYHNASGHQLPVAYTSISSTNHVPSLQNNMYPCNGDIGVMPKSAAVAQSISGPLGDFTRPVHDGIKPKDECAICLESLSSPSDYDHNPTADVQCVSADILQLVKCKHIFHRICLKRLHESGTSQNGCLRCPVCKAIHGVMKGNQPEGGTMSVTTNNNDIPGYPGYGSIIINYNFRSGVQGPNHPNPGQPFTASAFPRTCYLPNNPKGKKVLKLLQVAFERRLVFTVGRSVTSGQDNRVVWNDIHHKTEGYGNGSGYGYPDPNYLDNVLAELAAHGVTDDSS